MFPEVKTTIQEILKQDSNLRSADAELQQRASEYLQLSKIVSTDVLVCSQNKLYNTFPNLIILYFNFEPLGYSFGRDAIFPRT